MLMRSPYGPSSCKNNETLTIFPSTLCPTVRAGTLGLQDLTAIVRSLTLSLHLFTSIDLLAVPRCLANTERDGDTEIAYSLPNNEYVVYAERTHLKVICAYSFPDHLDSPSKCVSTYSTARSTLPNIFRLKHATR